LSIIHSLQIGPGVMEAFQLIERVKKDLCLAVAAAGSVVDFVPRNNHDPGSCPASKRQWRMILRGSIWNNKRAVYQALY
jgi:hypothetical protein